MEPTIQVAIITAAGAIGGAVIGWFGKVAVATLMAKPKDPWNGTERREAMVSYVTAAIALHANQCIGLAHMTTQVTEQLNLIRREIEGLREENREHLAFHMEHRGG